MEQHTIWMNRCLELAQEAFDRGEVPVGAVVIHQDRIIAEAYNLREQEQSVRAHAELLAIEKASALLGSWRLSECVLVTSLEPCVMCAGAIIQARIPLLIYGADDPKGGAESVFGLLNSNRHNHRVSCRNGVEAERSSQILKSFFSLRR